MLKVIAGFIFIFSIVFAQNADMIITEPGLCTEEKDALIFMYQEEKLAHDVYLLFAQSWQKPIFSNIAASEQRHMQAVYSLIETYNLQDSVPELKSGEFLDAGLQGLYDSLSQSKDDFVMALKAGALIEEVDITDLQERIQETANKDIIFVFENLLRGSRNHLRAFTRNLSRSGIEYKPQVLSSIQFSSIVESPQERGARGRGSCRRDRM